MLSGDFFETVSRTAEGTRIRLCTGHRIYDAHFPDHPVTPGVVLVQIAVELLSEREGRRLELVSSKGIKFLIPVGPGAELLYRFEEGGDGAWTVTVLTGTEPCARMNLILA